MDALMIARVPHTYAGWEMLPWPSTTTTRARVSSYARTISASSSPTMKSALIESSGTPYAVPWRSPVWPVATKVAGTPAAFSASVSRRAVVLFPIAPSVPSTGMRRHGSLRDRSLNCFESRIANIDEPHAVRVREPGELRIVVEILVQPRDDVQPVLDRLADRRPELLRDIAAKRGDADDQRLGPALCDGLFQVRDDRDAVRSPVEHLARIPSGFRVIDDAHDLVAFRVPNQAVRRLSRALAEIPVAQDHGPFHRPLVPCDNSGRKFIISYKA